MKVSTQQLPESQVLLEIEVDSEQLEKSMDRAYRKLVQRIDVPGFRKGKAPKNMLERQVGRGRILEEAIDIAVPDAYNKAIEEADIDAIGQPQIELVTADPLSFKATVPIRPTIDLGDYKSIRVEREAAEVDENDVQTTLKQLQQRYAIHEPVERPVQINDIIRAGVRITVDEREVFQDEDAELHLREGQTVLLPGFTEGAVGAKKGEAKQVAVAIPDDSGTSLAGKAALIDLTVKEVKEERLPEPDDEFAQQVGEGFPTIGDLMERLRGDIRERVDGQSEAKFRDDAMTALVENAATLEFPPVLVDREIGHFLSDQLRNTGMDLERYLQMVKKTEQEIREEVRPSATERVRRSLALGKLAEDEDLEVAEAEIDEEIENLVSQAGAADEEQLGRYRQLFGTSEARASLANSLLTRKTMDRLAEFASQSDGAKSPVKSKKKSGQTPKEKSVKKRKPDTEKEEEK
ncbi:MAG: trigger factor [Dehalococcoidia bacterium]